MSKFEEHYDRYDMYSQMQPVFGYYVDDDPKSPTFGQVLFGQIGERNAYDDVLEFKDETDLSYIKRQLLKVAKDSDWNAELDEESAKELNENEGDSVESATEGGDDGSEVDSAVEIAGEFEEKRDQA